ncbi:hypothetical protein WMY93_021540 [Mugilogobius chulae]|uniref:Uncharacterized protein n=1 Tax=Mugilogobius chulae TaxID=88201 RepID=A0AAW0NE72_9GOBI
MDRTGPVKKVDKMDGHNGVNSISSRSHHRASSISEGRKKKTKKSRISDFEEGDWFAECLHHHYREPSFGMGGFFRMLRAKEKGNIIGSGYSFLPKASWSTQVQ